VRLGRRKRVDTGDPSGVGYGAAARLPDHMLDFESWRKHRAEAASTADAERIIPASGPARTQDGNVTDTH
jgi:hypothetical protein